MSSALSLAFTAADYAELGKLPQRERQRVMAWRDALCEALGVRPVGAAMERLARRMGVSVATARRYYDRVREAGWDWHALIDGRVMAPAQPGLPRETIELYRRLEEESQRNSRAAYRRLLRMWQEGRPIPGYPVPPPPAPGSDHPPGWSENNFRRHRSTRFALTAMRQGLKAAMLQFGPQVLTTRVGLWVGSHLMIDDVQRDFEVLFLGNRGSRALIQELGILDVFSGHRFAVHRRPKYPREDGKMDSLKEREMRFLMASWSRHTGYSPRGTVILSELGTAAVRKYLARFYYEASGGKIVVQTPGILGKEQALAGYWGTGGGNARHKAHEESHHNLLQNEAAFLLAQTGHDRKPPEYLAGIDAITEDVLKALRTLPPERAAMLKTGMGEYFQSLELLAEIDRIIADRTWHKLEGWAGCGFTRLEFRRDLVADEWLPQEALLALPEHEQARLVTLAKRHPDFRRVRNLSPREAFATGAGELVTLPDHVIALMFCDRNLGDDLREPRKLGRGGTFSVTNSLVAPEPMIFEGHATAPDGGRVQLSERETYGTVLNPFDPDQLWIYDQRGAFVGTSPVRVRVSRLDDDAMRAALGQRAHEKARLLLPLRERHAGTTAALAEMQEYNRRVIAGQSATPEAIAADRASATRIRRERSTPEDYMPAPAPSRLPALDDERAPDFDIADFLSPNR